MVGAARGGAAFVPPLPEPGGAMKKPDGKVVLLGDMNVGKTSLLHRYMERRFQDTVSTLVGNAASSTLTYVAFKPLPGREQFHGLGSMYCRGAAAVILTYDVNSLQSLVELEDRFLALTDSASADCIFAIVGNKVDLSDDCASPPDENRPEKAIAGCSSKKMCFETSAKTGYKVDYLFETVFDMVVPIIVRQKAEGPPQTVDITDYKPAKRTKSSCCA
uniref:RAB20, member RAS onco family n=1 Tax=Coturnix japonica TaxID=93934 RepID=A0A8C2TWE0_COTJA